MSKLCDMHTTEVVICVADKYQVPYALTLVYV